MSDDSADVVVVGAGASGVIAAAGLLEAGKRVLLLDAEVPGDRYQGRVPERPYLSLRREDPEQHRYLLGEEYEGIALGQTGPLAQTTPPRQHVFRRALATLPVMSDGFAAFESLAAGGLAETWGAVAFPFTPWELEQAGLPADSMTPHYEAVARTIGVSGGDSDDLVSWRGPMSGLQPASRPDRNAAAILTRYQRHRARLQGRGFRLGRSMLAMLTRPLGARRENPGFGLDFWANPGGSVFRPSLLLEELRSHPRLELRTGLLALRFREQPGRAAEVEALDLVHGGTAIVRGGAVLLTAGALGTTRIVLRSLGRYDHPVPLVCNEHALIPSVRWGGIGGAIDSGHHALAQLTAMVDPTGDQRHLAQAQFYSFTGLPLARLLREAPCGQREALRIFRTLATSLVILVVQHEDLPGPGKCCRLRRASSPERDVLEFEYRSSSREVSLQRRAERVIRSSLRALGCWPIRVVRPGHGSSIHYGGMFPASARADSLTTAPDGRLHETTAVYVGDGAGLRYLPSKGLTLTLMANAHRIAERLAAARPSPALG